MLTEKHPGVPAKLPAHSRAAESQNLGERLLKPVPGVYYEVPHRNPHSKGWRTRRHIKRKNLHRSNRKVSQIERIGTQWSMLPLAFGSLLVVVILASLLVGFTAAVEATQQRYQQQIVTLADILPKDSLKMYDSQGSLLYQMTDQGLQTTIPLAKISLNLINAEVAIEDQNFWTDPGFDITGIVRAALSDLTNGHIVAGGSTITQQLIKNAIVGNQDTAIRKLQELIIAPAVTRQYTKQQIMFMYLNTTYYGEQAYGADAAAFTYFDLQDTPQHTAASQLDIAQAAMLAGIPSAPVGRDPFLYPHSAFLRAQEVLHQMRVQGYITAAQERAAIVEIQKPHFLHRGIISNNPRAAFRQLCS